MERLLSARSNEKTMVESPRQKRTKKQSSVEKGLMARLGGGRKREREKGRKEVVRRELFLT